jgi:S1-C subfamily serine protease
VESGDVIQSVNGQSIKSPGQVQDLVENTAIGSELPLQVSRDGKDLTLKVKVGVLPNVAQSE